MLIEHGWPKLVMPAIATEPQDNTIADDEVYSRPAGELLQPGWDSRDELDRTKTEIGSRKKFSLRATADSRRRPGDYLETITERFRTGRERIIGRFIGRSGKRQA
jgi:hypothetical protein